MSPRALLSTRFWCGTPVPLPDVCTTQTTAKCQHEKQANSTVCKNGQHRVSSDVSPTHQQADNVRSAGKTNTCRRAPVHAAASDPVDLLRRKKKKKNTTDRLWSERRHAFVESTKVHRLSQSCRRERGGRPEPPPRLGRGPLSTPHRRIDHSHGSSRPRSSYSRWLCGRYQSRRSCFSCSILSYLRATAPTTSW